MYRIYTIGQFYLDFTIPQNHLIYAISQFVDSILLGLLEGDPSDATCRSAYHPTRMLKISLIRHSPKVFSGRKITQMIAEILSTTY